MRPFRSIAFLCYVTPDVRQRSFRWITPGAIVLVGWIWLTNVALLFGAELNAAIGAPAAGRRGGPSPAADPV